MYKIAGVGLIGLFIFMILPTNAGLTDTYNQDNGAHYGAATIVVHDVNGNERFSQTIHNLLVDTGEDFLLDAVFDDGNAGPASNVAIGAICISDGNNGNLVVLDDETAADFDGDNQITEVNCKQANGGVTTTNGVATIGALTFNATGNLGADETVEGIGICLSNGAGSGGDYNDCATAGILFSVINTSNVTIANGEDVDITYTFDISSNSN